ncbi:MAG: hypothetical protein JOZ47_16515 [Kutzneria sp.]|nr:hypothetical protein [Kutzneria sp.]
MFKVDIDQEESAVRSRPQGGLHRRDPARTDQTLVEPFAVQPAFGFGDQSKRRRMLLSALAGSAVLGVAIGIVLTPVHHSMNLVTESGSPAAGSTSTGSPTAASVPAATTPTTGVQPPPVAGGGAGPVHHNGPPPARPRPTKNSADSGLEALWRSYFPGVPPFGSQGH